MKRFMLLALTAIFIMTMVSAASAVPRLQTYIVGSSYYVKVDLNNNVVGDWNPAVTGRVDNGMLGGSNYFSGGGVVNPTWWGDGTWCSGYRHHHDNHPGGPGCAAPEPGTLSLLGLGLLGMIPILRRKKD